jgi:hypothetical protein
VQSKAKVGVDEDDEKQSFRAEAFIEFKRSESALTEKPVWD